MAGSPSTRISSDGYWTVGLMDTLCYFCVTMMLLSVGILFLYGLECGIVAVYGCFTDNFVLFIGTVCVISIWALYKSSYFCLYSLRPF
jgi:hypothetical protein